jgi:2-hydroxychromene-2-carboxylate isomerase
MTETIVTYTDYKSPYAYLAKEMVYDLEKRFDVDVEWRPYILDIPAYLGSAERDAAGEIVSEERNAHQWRRVKYSYMDCRRYANRLGLTIRGTRKIFDSRLAGIGLLFARKEGVFRSYNDIVFERFWKRELDIEDIDAMVGVLAEAGADPALFAKYAESEGYRDLDAVQKDAEEKGVFGVPSFIIGGELFWGREHLPVIEEQLTPRAGNHPPAS